MISAVGILLGTIANLGPFSNPVRSSTDSSLEERFNTHLFVSLSRESKIYLTEQKVEFSVMLLPLFNRYLSLLREIEFLDPSKFGAVDKSRDLVKRLRKQRPQTVYRLITLVYAFIAFLAMTVSKYILDKPNASSVHI